MIYPISPTKLQAAGAIEIAIADLTRALSFPQCQSTASAHHELAIVLSKNNGDAHEIQLHFEKALDLGMDPTVRLSMNRLYAMLSLYIQTSYIT